VGEKLTTVFLAVMVCLPGCAEDHRADSGSLASPGDIRVTAMDRLRGENLPALREAKVWDNPYGPGLEMVTDHYRIRTTLLEPLMLRNVPGFLEAAHASYNEQLPQPIESSLKFDVYLFGRRQQWEKFTRSFAGDQAEIFCRIKTGAYYLNGACVVYDIGRSRTLAALGHEGWHQFNSRHFKYRLPCWLDEGVAMLFEESVCEQGTFRFVPGMNTQRLGSLSTIMNARGQMPLSELVTTSPGEAMAMDQADAVLAFYSQSYSLVRFLREAEGGRYLSGYRQMLRDGLTGQWPLDEEAKRTAADRNLPRTTSWNRTVGSTLFTTYVGRDFGTLDRQYKAYCGRILKGKSFVWLDDAGMYAMN
jgi:hypothetical protein